jgi:hypothetical protein
MLSPSLRDSGGGRDKEVRWDEAGVGLFAEQSHEDHTPRRLDEAKHPSRAMPNRHIKTDFSPA